MDIEALKDFVTLSDVKSFSKAAALRNVTQPAFSRRIRALEAAVGLELVDRESKAFKLSAPGQRFLAHARNLIELADSAVSEAKSVMTRLFEPVYLVTPSFVSKTFFPGWYKTMQKAVPGLTMRISHQSGSEAIEELRKGLADFALVLSAAKIEACYNFDGLLTRVIGCDRMLAVCARHVQDRGRLLLYERGSYMSRCAEAVLGKRYEPGKAVFESASTGLVKEMALAGFGTAVLQESLVEDDLAQGYLVPAFGGKPMDCDILLVRGPHSSCKKADLLWAANQSAAKARVARA
jgi:DNA-binding transcriptional LysR family regulator